MKLDPTRHPHAAHDSRLTRSRAAHGARSSEAAARSTQHPAPSRRPRTADGMDGATPTPATPHARRATRPAHRHSALRQPAWRASTLRCAVSGDPAAAVPWTPRYERSDVTVSVRPESPAERDTREPALGVAMQPSKALGLALCAL